MVFGNCDAFGQYVWTKDTHNRVPTGGVSGARNKHVLASSVLYNADPPRYEMWFAGAADLSLGLARFGFATSKDGINLTEYDDPAYRKAAEEAGTKAFVMKELLSDIFSILSPYLT
jgi:hypothetical protein